MKTSKTSKWLGKVSAKTVSATSTIAEKTLDTVKAAPGKTTNLTKTIGAAYADGWREVRPKADNSDEASELPESDEDLTATK